VSQTPSGSTGDLKAPAYMIMPLLKMTGCEGVLSKQLSQYQSDLVRLLTTSITNQNMQGETHAFDRFNLINQLLLTLGIKPFSRSFFDVVFDGIKFSDKDDVLKASDRFRTIAMLKFGNIRYAYKILRNDRGIKKIWDHAFSSIDSNRVKKTKINSMTHREPVQGLKPIDPDALFLLSYLASDDQKRAGISDARKELKKLLLEIVDKGIPSDLNELDEIFADNKGKLIRLLVDAGIPDVSQLLSNRDNYKNALDALVMHCKDLDGGRINEIGSQGNINAHTYMALHDLEVYVATSMRTPIHFTSNYEFVQQLFHNGTLKQLNIRYFDPTQSHLIDRIQKGLLECLMIRRAKLTVYNAQDADTFGKDAEAGVTLAQGKPVVVFVARLFATHERFLKLYELIDKLVVTSEENIPVVVKAYEGVLLESGYARSLGTGLVPIVTKIIKDVVNNALEGVQNIEVAIELIKHGYDPIKSENTTLSYKEMVRRSAVDVINKLETRAITFKTMHPLSLQTSPFDGVARGVIITRTVDETAQTIYDHFVGTTKYVIDDLGPLHYNTLLREERTKSPVRVVTNHPALTTAFWNEQWGDPENHPFKCKECVVGTVRQCIQEECMANDDSTQCGENANKLVSSKK